MKQIKKLLLIAMYSITTQLVGQTSVQPFEATIQYDDAQRPCIQVNLDPEPKTLKEAWKDYLKDNYDLKIRGIGFLTNKDLLSAEGVVMSQVSAKEMDFYTHIVENENGSEMKLFIRLGYDIYINPKNYPNEYAALQEVLESFIKFYVPKYMEQQIKDTEEAVKKLTHEKDDLSENIQEKSNEIDELKQEIREKEAELTTNQEALSLTERKLSNRKEKLERTRTALRKL